MTVFVTTACAAHVLVTAFAAEAAGRTSEDVVRELLARHPTR